jgi:hypothetical protein
MPSNLRTKLAKHKNYPRFPGFANRDEIQTPF